LKKQELKVRYFRHSRKIIYGFRTWLSGFKWKCCMIRFLEGSGGYDVAYRIDGGKILKGSGGYDVALSLSAKYGYSSITKIIRSFLAAFRKRRQIERHPAYNTEPAIRAPPFCL
jgi:hypothetical protein